MAAPCGVAVGEAAVEHVRQRADQSRGLGFCSLDAAGQVAAAQHRALGDRRLPGGQHPGAGACAEDVAVPLDVTRREILVRCGRAWQLRAAARHDAVRGGGAELGEQLVAVAVAAFGDAFEQDQQRSGARFGVSERVVGGAVDKPKLGEQVVQARALQLDASQGDQRPHRVEHGHVGQVPVGLLQLVAQHRDVEPDVVGGDDDRLSVAWFEQREQLVRDVVEARFAGEMVVADVVDGVRDRVDGDAGIDQTLPTATDRAVPAGDRADRHATAGRAVRGLGRLGVEHHKTQTRPERARRSGGGDGHSRPLRRAASFSSVTSRRDE